MRPYGDDLRERVLASLEEGMGAAQTAERFKLHRRTVERWRTRGAKGERTSRPMGGHRVSVLKEHESTLRQWIAVEPGITLERMCLRLEAELQVKISQAGLCLFLNKIGLRYKKNAAGQRTRSS